MHFEKSAIKFLPSWMGHFGGSPPGGADPDLIYACYGPEGPEKVVYIWGESAPIWGKYGNLKIAFLSIFDPQFLRISSSVTKIY